MAKMMRWLIAGMVVGLALLGGVRLFAQVGGAPKAGPPPSAKAKTADNLPVPRRGQNCYVEVIEGDFAQVRAKLAGEKAQVMQEARALLAARYDLANRAARGCHA